MNWSAYSRFVGDVFGAPLAMEGLAAFFLESTFLGLWIFGWDRLPKRVHLACIWAGRRSVRCSAAMFILPPTRGCSTRSATRSTSHGPARAQQHLALFTNPTFLWGYVHVILASLVTGCAGDARGLGVVPAQAGSRSSRSSARRQLALIVLIPTLVLALFVGSELGVVESQVPADQDRRRRGAMDHVPAVLVLGVPDRGRQATTRRRRR